MSAPESLDVLGGGILGMVLEFVKCYIGRGSASVDRFNTILKSNASGSDTFFKEGPKSVGRVATGSEMEKEGAKVLESVVGV